jgi:hypothetical protein
MKILGSSLAWLIVAVFPMALWATESPDLAILRQADESRGNLAGVSWDVRIVSNEKNEYRRQDFFVRAKEFDVLAMVTFPPRHKGDKILMVKRNMWFSNKDLTKPVPISQRQKLQGLAAYGDIPATNYTDDYRAKRLPSEVVNGEECFVFDLTAKDKKRSTYDKVRYWISKQRLVGVKSDFFTVSGMLIKTAYHKYDNAILTHGKRRPFISQIDFRDALRPKLETSMLFTAPSIRPVPSHIFNVNLMTQ